MRMDHRYMLEIPEPRPSLSWHGAPIRGFGFSQDQINRYLSGAHVLRSEHEDKHI